MRRTCLLKASGMVNVDVIQQYVLTGCAGSEFTRHDIGLPTNCDAVMITEHVSNKQHVK